MIIKHYPQCQDFLKAVEPFLLKAPQLNNLMLGLLYRLKNQEPNADDLFLTLTEGDHTLVVMMSGLYLILYANTQAPALYMNAVTYLEAQGIDYPGIIGPVDVCEAFKKAYETHTQTPLIQAMRQRIFMIERLVLKPTERMRLILATPAHTQTLLPWVQGFLHEINERDDIDLVASKLETMIEQKHLYVLESNDEIVSMAASIRPFLTGISVGYVYTPPVYRNRGYATTCVAHLTAHLLKSHTYCTLYTDLANPTSNSIYQKIGYQPVGDSVVYTKTH